ncbi:hypothetical protein [Bacteroides sp.]|uniref:ATP-dependent DNA ligase n=1 Tax=Bacteroides sp. TaxID=29523 RepID=UPI002614DC70|nr:hypothetical protein [Bacteroides sp.]MDD3040563.1 hypothetical protein [Bacteroides sp.]
MTALTPVFLMKAKPYDPTKDNIEQWFVQEKFDGVRIQIIVNGLDDIRIYSRNKTKETGTFNEYTEKLPHIVTYLREKLMNMPEMFHTQIFDGEALASNQGSREKNFTYVTGTLNADDSYTRQCNNELIHIVLFNIPTIEEEYRYVLTYLHLYFPITGALITSPETSLNVDSSAMLRFDDIIGNGGEGIILYNPACKYKFGRSSCAASKDVLKIKDRKEREVKVIGMVEGTGKDIGTCGALICDDGMGKIFRIGSGLTEGAATERGSRNWMWAHKDDVPFIIEMYYHSETPDSYRLPIYKRDRYYDKSPDEMTIG